MILGGKCLYLFIILSS